MRAWGITDVGLRRSENQDCFAIEEEIAEGMLLAVVCDGMGGASAGSLASTIAVEAFVEDLKGALHPGMDREQLRETCRAAVAAANTAVYLRACEDPALSGMGTTLVSALLCGSEVTICNVGDSRAYRLTDSTIERVTRDHSVVENMVRHGDITPEQARVHPSRNLITRALGPEDRVECDVYELTLAAGERLLLCSDGLVVTATDADILRMAASREDGKETLQMLMAFALAHGAPDNVTLVLAENL